MGTRKDDLQRPRERQRRVGPDATSLDSRTAHLSMEELEKEGRRKKWRGS